MIGRSLLVLLAFISLTACGYPGAYSISRDVKFSKRGVTQQQLDADWSACRKENTVAMSFAETEPKQVHVVRRRIFDRWLHGCEGLHCDVVDKNPKAPAATRACGRRDLGP